MHIRATFHPFHAWWCRLGLGDTQNRGDAADEMGDNLPAVDLGTGEGCWML